MTTTEGRQPTERPIAVGGTLSADCLLTAVAQGLAVIPNGSPLWTQASSLRYRGGVEEGSISIFPAGTPVAYDYTWWSPEHRFVVPTDDVRLGKSIRPLLRTLPWSSTLNHAFGSVIEECRRDREPRWITDAYVEVMTALHAAGWTYSVEIWEGEILIGGGFGFAIGGVVSMDSHFYRRDSASIIAMIDAARRAGAAGARFLDLQWPTDHGGRVGGRPVPRSEFLAQLGDRPRPLRLATERRPIAWVLPL